MSKTKNYVIKIVMAALCVALGVVLPMAFHWIPNAGRVMLPMHIPVLLCGLICGPFFGLACGVLTPLLSSLTTGMPPMAVLPGMLCELAVYGFVAGLLIYLLRTKFEIANIYIALVGAMLCGRIVSGALNALIFSAGEYSMQIWMTGAFVTAIPGIVIQLVIIPVIVFASRKAKLIDTKPALS